MVRRHGRCGVPEHRHPGGLRPRHIIILAGDHVYKMDYEGDARARTRAIGGGCELKVGCVQVPRAAASGFGVMQVDASGRIIAFVEAPPIRLRPFPAGPIWRWPAWGSTCSKPARCSRNCGGMQPTRVPARDFGADIILRSSRGRAPPPTASPAPVCARRDRTLLARRRHRRAWWESEHPPDRRHQRCRHSTSTTGTGRSGPMARSRRRRNSCMTRMGGAARPSPAGLSRGCIISGACVAFPAVHRLPPALLWPGGG